MANYKKLTDVSTAQRLLSTDRVLVNKNGSICQVEGIGEITDATGSSASNIPNNTATKLIELTLEAGTYLVDISAQWDTNGNGYRRISINTTDALSPNRLICDSRTAVSGIATTQSLLYPMIVPSQTKFYIYAQQNSGGSLNCNWIIRTIKLG